MVLCRSAIVAGSWRRRITARIERLAGEGQPTAMRPSRGATITNIVARRAHATRWVRLGDSMGLVVMCWNWVGGVRATNRTRRRSAPKGIADAAHIQNVPGFGGLGFHLAAQAAIPHDRPSGPLLRQKSHNRKNGSAYGASERILRSCGRPHGLPRLPIRGRRIVRVFSFSRQIFVPRHPAK